jgi:hypothetical protein
LENPSVMNPGARAKMDNPSPAIFSDALAGALGSLKKETTWNPSAKLKDTTSGTDGSCTGVVLQMAHGRV